MLSSALSLPFQFPPLLCDYRSAAASCLPTCQAEVSNGKLSWPENHGSPTYLALSSNRLGLCPLQSLHAHHVFDISPQ
ncbi:unnamed protein product [Linum trigynum]|uniref:Uncharacterized protein n=1 Tax=Linum trigynum TaxID=586398 RepID=A0AAV2CS24_9ROSI